jgi:hypothetical protein
MKLSWIRIQTSAINGSSQSNQGTDHLVSQNQLYAKLNKCKFWLKEVSFLGHIISEGGISIDPSKVNNVLSCNTPQNVLDIRSFLGLA